MRRFVGKCLVRIQSISSGSIVNIKCELGELGFPPESHNFIVTEILRKKEEILGLIRFTKNYK